MEESYRLATQALQAITKLEDSLNSERDADFPTREDLDIIHYVGAARFALMNAQAFMYDKQKKGVK